MDFFLIGPLVLGTALAFNFWLIERVFSSDVSTETNNFIAQRGGRRAANASGFFADR